MSTVSKHLSKHPSARSSTIAWLEMRDRKLAELRAEIARDKADTAPVASLGPMPSWLKRMVLPHAIKQVADRLRGM